MHKNESSKLCNLSSHVREFFNPLLQKSNISYMLHLRIFNDGRAFVLGNRPEYVQHFIDNNYCVPEAGTFNKYEMQLWSGIIGLQTYDSQVADMRSMFNIDHQISFFFPHNKYTDIYDLGTTTNRPELVNYFINNRDVLEQHFLAYLARFHTVLDTLNAEPYALPIRPKNFDRKIELMNQFCSITKREFECLHLLAHGKTAKMIASHMDVSPRTIERHIDNIREKLQLKYKIELVNHYKEYIYSLNNQNNS